MWPKLKLWLGMLPGVLALTATRAVQAAEVNMPRGVTSISRDTYDLHMIIIWICVAIGVVVFGVLLWSIIRYRKSRGVKAATFHENTTVEIIWTVIPFLILVSMAIPSTAVLTDIYDTSEAELDILVTGYQWRWQYEYQPDSEEGATVSFFSNLETSEEEISNLARKEEDYLLDVDQHLVIPVDTKVRLLLTSADVIHSWWVPEFAVKKDAIPGFINESWVNVEEPGIYRGQCTELCGQDHGFMPIVVEAVPREEFETWYSERQEEAERIQELASQEWTMEELMSRGENVYNTFCMACHQDDGEGVPPQFPPLNNSEIVQGSLEEHVDVVMNGVQGTSMAAFGPQLNPVDMAAVITYERNSWDNSTGDMVEPADILEMQAEAE